ncbi:methyl-accepting chemotaxis protein [Arenibaculum pallidiluteum]|uniref:methyl-accepting chemotaxis protein n=1 Tax=Arenibaculum pallidiluteum TaxID=2812559 RepID=UPI001F1E6BCD|nr:cache domain-containing protein [Arenibaculum pallidiluteum]
MNNLRNISINRRLWAMALLAVAGLLAVASLGSWTLRDQLMQDRARMSRSAVDSAMSIVAAYEDRARRGELTAEQAQTSALAALRAMRFDGGEYVWVNRPNGVMVMHPVRPELEGKDMLGFRDPAGTYIFREFVKATTETGSGFVPYAWPKPGFDEPVAKISFVRHFKAWDWIVGSGIYLDDVQAEMRDALLQAGLGILATTIVLGLCVWAVARSLARPLQSLTRTMQDLASGDTSVVLADLDRRNELGAMARAVEVFRVGAIERAKLEAQAREEAVARAHRTAAIEALVDEFDQVVHGLLQTVAVACQRFSATARDMTALANETNLQASSAATASEQTSANVQTVAAAAEEMASSIGEIGRQVTRSSVIAGQAVGEAERINADIVSLDEAARRIGDVIGLIQDIASQTNLLALNATIEAARAGEAGKGFAVVAGEVKALAAQTAKATEEIAAQVGSIQQATAGTVGGIRGIGGTIQSMNEISSTVAAAIEEQGAATQEISRNVQEAAAATREVSAGIGAVTRAADQTGSTASQVLASAESLTAEADRLRAAVSRFIAGVRAA